MFLFQNIFLFFTYYAYHYICNYITKQRKIKYQNGTGTSEQIKFLLLFNLQRILNPAAYEVYGCAEDCTLCEGGEGRAG